MTQEYDVRTLIPALMTFMFTITSIFYIEYLRSILLSLWGILLIILFMFFIRHLKTKNGYGIHADRKSGEVIFLATLVCVLCLTVGTNLVFYKKQYDSLKTLEETNNTYFGHIKQYLDKTPKGYKTTIKITHISMKEKSCFEEKRFCEQENKIHKITPFEIHLFIKPKIVEKQTKEKAMISLENDKTRVEEKIRKARKGIKRGELEKRKIIRNQTSQETNPKHENQASQENQTSHEKQTSQETKLKNQNKNNQKTKGEKRKQHNKTTRTKPIQEKTNKNNNELTKTNQTQLEIKLTQHLEKKYSPGTQITFTGKIKTGKFYEKWMTGFTTEHISTQKTKNYSEDISAPKKSKPTSNTNTNTGNTNINIHSENPDIKILNPPNYMWKIGEGIRRKIMEKISFHKETDPLILGMSVGNTNYISPTIIQNMKNTSTMHLTSVSGTHICVITLFLHYILFWIRPKIKILLICCTLICLIFIIGPLIPIMRSIFMALLGYSAIITKNQRRATPIFSIIFLLFLLHNPLVVINFSFLLSSFATLGIILFVKPLTNVVYVKTKLNMSVLNTIFVSFVAQIVTTPIVLVFQPKISIIGVLTNVLISPIVPLVTISGLLVGVLPSFMNQIFYEIASLASFGIGKIVDLIVGLKIGIVNWGNGFYEIFVYFALIFLCFLGKSIFNDLKHKFFITKE